LDIVAWRIHKVQPALPVLWQCLGIFNNTLYRCCTALANTAKRFLLNCRQPASNIAGTWIASSHILAHASNLGLEGCNDIIQPLLCWFIRSSLCQHMLCTDNLCRLSDYCAAAACDQLIHRCAQSRVGA